MFDVKGKVALITGGASGIGFCVAKEFLRNGAKGVTIADINEINGKTAITTLEEQYGKDKAIFVKMDVTRKDEFEVAFSQTLQKFQHIDILFNNTGVFNDFNWEKEVDVNVQTTLLSETASLISNISRRNRKEKTHDFQIKCGWRRRKKGVVNGMILGLENYLKQHKQGAEAVILNTASVGSLRSVPWMPIYAATKAAVTSLTTSWGCDIHYERTKVRVVALCPGATETPLFHNENCGLSSDYVPKVDASTQKYGIEAKQSPDFVSKEVLRIIKYAPNGSVWVVEDGEPAYQYKFADRETFKNNVLQEIN